MLSHDLTLLLTQYMTYADHWQCELITGIKIPCYYPTDDVVYVGLDLHSPCYYHRLRLFYPGHEIVEYTGGDALFEAPPGPRLVICIPMLFDFWRELGLGPRVDVFYSYFCPQDVILANYCDPRGQMLGPEEDGVSGPY